MRKKGTSSKLSPKWEGPYVIIKRITDVVYRIKKEKGRKRVVVHFNCRFSKEEENQDKTKCVETELSPNQTVHTMPEPSVQKQEEKQSSEEDDSDEEWIVETRGSQNTSATNSNRESYPSVLQRPAPSQTARNPDAEFHNGIRSNLANRPRRTRRLPDWTKDYTLNTK